jgi:hypothetical protein
MKVALNGKKVFPSGIFMICLVKNNQKKQGCYWYCSCLALTLVQKNITMAVMFNKVISSNMALNYATFKAFIQKFGQW